MSKNEFICDCNIIHEDKVKKTLKAMPDENTFNKIAEFFKIMGDTTRTKILFALDSNEMCVCDIANVLNMTKSSISHQLGTLRRMNIVKCRREGKEVYYTLDDDHIKEVFEQYFDVENQIDYLIFSDIITMYSYRIFFIHLLTTND